MAASITEPADIVPGSLAVSKCGRDRGRVLIITGTDENGYVYLVDGKLRKLCKPKRKKLKHVSLIGVEIDGVDTLTNRKAAFAVRKADVDGCITDEKE